MILIFWSFVYIDIYDFPYKKFLLILLFIQEIKQGYLAQRHALVVAKNLKLLTTGGDEHKMAVYKPGWPLAIVSLGRNEAVAQIFFGTLIGCFPGRIKSKDLFVGKTRKQMGLDPHLVDA